MTAPSVLNRSDTSPRKSRRSRSPESKDDVTPSSARRRSEDRESALPRKKVEFTVPTYLRLSSLDIEQKHMTLMEEDTMRMRESVVPGSEWYLESDPITRSRNRYSNVQPWAKNRIHLSVPDGKSDYINASPIVLHSRLDKRPHHFIATQGPKENQISHFWRMVWTSTQDPAVVVMLTQCWESGRDKCHAYFPDSPDYKDIPLSEDDFGDGFSGSVSLVSLIDDDQANSVLRKLKLTVGDKSKTVWHMQYSVWPDYEVPAGEDRAALLNLIKFSAEKASEYLSSKDTKTESTIPTPAPAPLPLLPTPPSTIPTISPSSSSVSANPSPSPINPRIVHCSAGVGRSGTFIALDFLLSELSDGSLRDLGANNSPIDANADPVFETVRELRRQRVMMVQSDAQLAFLYQTLRAAWEERYLVTDDGGKKAESEKEDVAETS